MPRRKLSERQNAKIERRDKNHHPPSASLLLLHSAALITEPPTLIEAQRPHASLSSVFVSIRTPVCTSPFETECLSEISTPSEEKKYYSSTERSRVRRFPIIMPPLEITPARSSVWNRREGEVCDSTARSNRRPNERAAWTPRMEQQQKQEISVAPSKKAVGSSDGLPVEWEATESVRAHSESKKL